MRDYPTDWKRYRGLVQAGVLDEDGNLNRFAARYRMASKLEGVRFTGFSATTQAGYTEGLRVTLAYSALEALESVVQSLGRGVIVDSPTLADVFRSQRCSRLRTHLDLLLADKKLKARICELEDESVTDVRPVAQGLRVVVAHGSFSPDGSGLSRSRTTHKFVADLAQEVIASTDRHFTAWLPPGLDP